MSRDQGEAPWPSMSKPVAGKAYCADCGRELETDWWWRIRLCAHRKPKDGQGCASTWEASEAEVEMHEQ